MSQPPTVQARLVAQPNILLIMADQFAAHMLSCVGTGHVATPNLDRLAADGVHFTRAYASFPLCAPSRMSMWSGRYASQLQVGSNVVDDKVAAVTEPAPLMSSLAQAGYRCAYAGKWHAPRPEAAEGNGVDVVSEFGDVGLVDAVRDFLAGNDTGRPFFLTVSFDDPHTICEYARRQPMPYGDVDVPNVDETPNLPVSFGTQPFEPEALRFEQDHQARMFGTSSFTPEDWRRYRHVYARLVERVDAQVGELLDALTRAGLDESTVVLFTSDHGDGDAAHAWNQKLALYEEIIRVPLLARWPGRFRSGVVDHSLVQVGTDLLPTLCEVAGARTPEDVAGVSLVSALTSGAAIPRDNVVVETDLGGQAPRTLGWAIVGARYKYVLYSWGRGREQLHDLRADPAEMINLAVERDHRQLLEQYRRYALDWGLAHGARSLLRRLVLPADVPTETRQHIHAIPY